MTITGGGPNNFYGTILDPNGTVTVHDKLLTGELIGNTITDTSGFSVNFQPFSPPPTNLTNTATVGAFGASTQKSTATVTVNSAAPQLAAGSASSAGAGLSELLGSSQLHTGTLAVAVQLPQGPETAAEAAAIANAIASLNSQVAALGVTLVEASAADADAASIHITMAATSPLGGVDQGVMGSFTTAGDITLVNGWNWYFGSGSAAIAKDQFDFQTVVTHELGHVLGLGESSDPGSVMSLYLSPGQVNRNLTANDLNALGQELLASAGPLPASPAPAVSDSDRSPLVAGPMHENPYQSGPQEITLVSSGTYRLGEAEPAGTAQSGYGIPTPAMYELAHATALREGTDANAGLHSNLAMGDASRNLTANDLVFVELQKDVGPGEFLALAGSTGVNPGDQTGHGNAALASMMPTVLANVDPFIISDGGLDQPADFGMEDNFNSSVLEVPMAANYDSLNVAVFAQSYSQQLENDVQQVSGIKDAGESQDR